VGAAVVLHSDAAPVLEFGEEVLDLVAFLLGRFAVGDWLTAVFLRRDTCLVPLILKDFPDFRSVIATVCDQHPCRRQARQQYIRALEIAVLASGQMQTDRAARTVANGVQFAVHATIGAPYQARPVSPFLRLDAVRCTLRCVASIISISASGPVSLASSPKIFSKIPLSDQRTNRL